MVDHSIPIGVIGKVLWADPFSWTRETLREFLLKNYKRAVISYAEDQRLTEYGLRSNMPKGWKLGDDPYARYAEVGIEGAPGNLNGVS